MSDDDDDDELYPLIVRHLNSDYKLISYDVRFG